MSGSLPPVLDGLAGVAGLAPVLGGVLVGGALLLWPRPATAARALPRGLRVRPARPVRPVRPARPVPATPAGGSWRRRGRRRGRRAGQSAPDVVEALEVLGVLLRSGSDPTTALSRLVTHLRLLVPGCRPDVAAALRAVADVAELGGDVPRAWVAAARATGEPRLLSVAAAWDVASSTGSSLAPVLHRVLEGARRDGEVDHDVAVALAGPEATATLLSLLPVAGPLLGALMGVDVLGVLVGTTAGQVSAGVGLALAVAGRVWTRRLVARARPAAKRSGSAR